MGFHLGEAVFLSQLEEQADSCHQVGLILLDRQQIVG